MPSPDTITVSQLSRLIGTPDAPILIDVRIDDDFNADPRILPLSKRRRHKDVAEWAGFFSGKTVVVSCQRGLKLSQGVAAWLRHVGARAQSLEGGHEAWVAAGQTLVVTTHVPAVRPSVWVTRARPKIDRIACPWLIRRFVDPEAVFLFVSPAEVANVADRFGAVAFDIEGVFWSHRGALCTFDVMIEEFGLGSAPLLHLGRIVRAADTGRLGDEPEAAGLLAASLGFSRMYRDDLAQLEAAMGIYDAFYRWARDAVEERHNWPAPQGGVGVRA